MNTAHPSGWHFIDSQGTFELQNPQQNSYVYFPLLNQAGMMSSITPRLNGDAKLGQNAFLLLPVSAEDLHNTRSARNFWARIKGQPWSVSGNSATQISNTGLDEQVTLQAGFLWHKIDRHDAPSGLRATVINFVPADDQSVELMQVTLSNQGEETLTLDPIAAIPIFARSADNLRDHRHVSSLLHRTTCHPYGVLVKPTMTFDERGHQENQTTYGVLGCDGDGHPPQGFTPLVEDFIGEGGSLDWPAAVLTDQPVLQQPDSTFEGYETIAGLHFPRINLAPGQSQHYILILGIFQPGQNLEALIEQYGSEQNISKALAETQAFWQEKLGTLRFDHQDERYDGWLQWVTLQPVLRRLMGNSFLPYHDYGRGGRGWRDLWQDLLALLITEQTDVESLLLGNYAGVRMDGSNATIVGLQPGEFKADRNSIPRVWMDHGTWPLVTTKRYLDLTGNLDLLLAEQTYFRDHLSHRGQRVNHQWSQGGDTALRAVSGEVVKGTILEHLLVQHLTAFFNVGEHNIIRLEGGDWNDGLDMAAERGESVAFSAMYAGNLSILSDLCMALVGAGVDEMQFNDALYPLLDQLSNPVDYDSVDAKQNRLAAYLDDVRGALSGKKIRLSLEAVSHDLTQKANWLTAHIKEQEWIEAEPGLGWFNGYYDAEGRRVDGKHSQGARMSMTGQVFPLMAGIASEEQTQAIIQAANRYLYDQDLKSYRLNTNFGTADLPKLGRAFGFAYGHKENGAFFSHMTVMFAYALYRQGHAQEAYHILGGLYQLSQDFDQSRIYPGIPEYFNPRGRGMYPYLTGSAAWYLFTLLTESFGVQGNLGSLCLAPKLVKDQFVQSDHISVKTVFAHRDVVITYNNPSRLSFGAYCIGDVTVNDTEIPVPPGIDSVHFTREEIEAWPEHVVIKVGLSPL